MSLCMSKYLVIQLDLRGRPYLRSVCWLVQSWAEHEFDLLINMGALKMRELMIKKDVLQDWVVAALKDSGGSASIVQVAQHM